MLPQRYVSIPLNYFEQLYGKSKGEFCSSTFPMFYEKGDLIYVESTSRNDCRSVEVEIISEGPSDDGVWSPNSHVDVKIL